MADVGGKPKGEVDDGDEVADIMPPMQSANSTVRHVVPARNDSPEPIAGEPVGEEETRVFRREDFDGKTREEVDALIANFVKEGKTNPFWMRAGREALADLEALEAKVDVITEGVATKAITAMTALKKARRPARKAARKGEKFELSIADQSIEDPEKAYETFLAAIALVKKQVPSFLKVRIEDIKFQKLAGDVVGKSTEDGITIDPVMLLHPVMRLATVIFHEALHANNQIPNEGLVQAQTEMYFGGMKTLEEYDKAVDKFTKFADIYGKGNIEGATKKIYKLYYNASKNGEKQNYLRIYSEFAKKARKRAGFPDENSIKKFFFEVFPELEQVKFDVD